MFGYRVMGLGNHNSVNVIEVQYLNYIWFLYPVWGELCSSNPKVAGDVRGWAEKYQYCFLIGFLEWHVIYGVNLVLSCVEDTVRPKPDRFIYASMYAWVMLFKAILLHNLIIDLPLIQYHNIYIGIQIITYTVNHLYLAGYLIKLY